MGGVSAALGLVKAGCDVIILERASGMPQPTTGAVGDLKMFLSGGNAMAVQT